jgi:hypothetical protein
LVKALPRWRRSNPGEERLREWPELRRRWRQDGGGGWRNPRGLGGNYPEGSPTRPLLYLVDTPAGLSGQASPDNPPPGYSAQGGWIFRPGNPELNNLEFSKTDVVLTKNLNSCAKIRCLEIGWLR